MQMDILIEKTWFKKMLRMTDRERERVCVREGKTETKVPFKTFIKVNADVLVCLFVQTGDLHRKTLLLGPWWWSSGLCARLLL